MASLRWKTWLRGRVIAQQRGMVREGDVVLPELGALTGQDACALAAIAECWELYAVSDEAGSAGALSAVRALLPAMQPQCRPFARELIAFALDWRERDRLWPKVQGEPISAELARESQR